MSSKDALTNPPSGAILRYLWTAAGCMVCVGGVWLMRQLPVNQAVAQNPSAAPRVNMPIAQKAPVRQVSTNQNLTTKPVNKVAAVVNGEQITRDELGKECLKRYGDEVLESMVNRTLIQNACREANIQITEQDVADEIASIAKKFKLPVERWMAMLKEERGIAEDQYRREIIWPTLALRRLAADKIQVSAEELNRAFESERGASVRVRIIGTSRESVAREALAKARANPEAFPEIAKRYCEDPNIASVGGAIPPIRKYMGDAALEKVAFALKPGQVSDIVQVQNQYFVMRCEGQDPAQYISPEQIRLVEDELRERLRDQKLRTSSQDFFQALQKKAKVVNVFNDPQLRTQQPGVAATINGQPITIAQLSEDCIARHGKEVIDGEINRKLLQQALTRQNTSVTQADLDREVDAAAISYNCVHKDGSADREKWLKQVEQEDGATIELYIRDAVWPSVALKKLVQAKVQVTPEDLQKGFESNYGPRVEVQAIVLGNMRQAQQVWDMARNNNTTQAFGDLAEQYSVEPVSRANRGQVPPVRKFGGQPIIEAEAFKMKPGDLSTILSVGDKFVVLRCVGRTQPVVTQIDEVKEELVKDLREKKYNAAMSETFDRIRETSQIDNFIAGTSQSGQKTAGPGKPAEPVGSPRVGSLPRDTK
jgi:parvulin-like peptidyl-prolyl isomerase